MSSRTPHRDAILINSDEMVLEIFIDTVAKPHVKRLICTVFGNRVFTYRTS